MPKKRHKPGAVIGKLRDADAMLSGERRWPASKPGIRADVSPLANPYGGMKAEGGQRPEAARRGEQAAEEAAGLRQS